MDWNILEGTINGWHYVEPVLTTGVALGFGYIIYVTKRGYQQSVENLHERDRIKEKPTFWNSKRLLTEWENSDDPTPQERERIELGRYIMRKYFW